MIKLHVIVCDCPGRRCVFFSCRNRARPKTCINLIHVYVKHSSMCDLHWLGQISSPGFIDCDTTLLRGISATSGLFLCRKAEWFRDYHPAALPLILPSNHNSQYNRELLRVWAVISHWRSMASWHCGLGLSCLQYTWWDLWTIFKGRKVGGHRTEES